MLRSHARARCGQVGPGWKPSAEQLESSHILAQQNPALRGPAASGGLARAATPVPPDETAAVGSDDGRTMLGWVPSNNPFEQDWTPAPLKPSASGVKGEVEVDLTGPRLAGKEPLAVRLGWPMFGHAYHDCDTCCPTAKVQAGMGVCIPGNCPLYSSKSELAANPFFAAIKGGKCSCMAPQDCSA